MFASCVDPDVTRLQPRRRFAQALIAACAIGWIGGCDVASAQLGQAIPAQLLVEPWNRAAELLRSLPPALDSVEAQNRQRLEAELGALEAQLFDLESFEQGVAIKIASNPAFAYEVSSSSEQMARQIAQIETGFDRLFGELSMSARADVVAMRQATAALHESLSDKNRLERDVLQALGSGSKNAIQALAASWWDGSESVGRARQAIAQVRREWAVLRER